MAGRTDFARLWAVARHNFAVLNHCPGPHDFKLVGDKPAGLGAKYACSHCGGIVDNLARQWYTLGLDHARREAQ